MNTQQRAVSEDIGINAGRKTKMKLHPERKKEERAFWIFASPWIIGFILFTGGPMIASLWLSFTSYDVVSAPQFVGFDNFISLFQDALFFKSLSVTTYYVVLAVPFTIMLSLLLAVLLNQKIKGLLVFRTLFYAPSIVSGVSIAFLWSWLLNPDFGFVNNILHDWFGVEGLGWFTDAKLVIPSMVLMQITGIGGTMVIFLASLQSLPKDLYEAADIDGAGSFRKFFKITVPLISPVILFNTIMAIISSFQIFTQAYVITKGGPEWNSYFYVYYLFDTAFSQFRMGYASAQAWILFIIIFALTMLSLMVSRRYVYYEYTSRK
ncbi:carbohydrate ABC transporter permease [Paenibacillus apiarius]|uniref:Sugar ABC transporter permease n=1 Tax=Paenibacillus apiarius TaxID=46240 RepID=A0ABT4DLU8_9BACL|nr:sugar ABC transporter permease [Paenibacillus apiarius]MCY9517727.1 sugar ABC transporter permease [Paenibacillus apiarius]MCY9518327.1 sugar ABC transporter permease [Paenibacillus apiarius]MCY9551272.1 sugar ABC transporter permease [Paenibacillus apiarius]MCY9558426.1 sugar ABC transporter permease [Paenibacillus apiarius]MCY9687077.1 sugar ABC transporter permease [Paenibacillus apiarius]